MLKSGVLGEIKITKAWNVQSRGIRKPAPDSEPPTEVDYDRWLGPAPERPFNVNRFHKTWRFFRDYSNGDFGDDGTHDLDMAAWRFCFVSLTPSRTRRWAWIVSAAAAARKSLAI